MRKLLIASIAILVIGATALTADLNGVWEGTGRGRCETPTGIIIYPWHEWSGTMVNGVTFSGDWRDQNGQRGKCSGSVIAISPTTALCVGTWNWIDASFDPPVVYEMGSFQMYFNYVADTCWGTWTAYSGEGGTMRGYDTD